MLDLHPYKNYQATVTPEDGAWLIQVVHIADHVTTTCRSTAQAQTAFQELIDDYFETCKSVGKQPEKPALSG